jgi:hypothetical protein
VLASARGRKDKECLAYVAFRLTQCPPPWTTRLRSTPASLSYALVQADSVFYEISDFNVITRYVNSSHQDDPAALSSNLPWHSMPFAPFNPVPAQITAKSILFISLKGLSARIFSC